jgi:hypothetical protein
MIQKTNVDHGKKKDGQDVGKERAGYPGFKIV